MAKVRAAGDEIDDESEAARRRQGVQSHRPAVPLPPVLGHGIRGGTCCAARPGRRRDNPAVRRETSCRNRACQRAADHVLGAVRPRHAVASVDIGQVFSEHLRPYRNAHVQVQSVWGMTVAEELLTFDGMCEKNGIDPCDGLDRLTACPEWFAADDYADAHADRPRCRWRKAADRPAGPGRCSATCPPARGRRRRSRRHGSAPRGDGGIVRPRCRTPLPLTPRPGRCAHACGP